jgi:hypothetical protein
MGNPNKQPQLKSPRQGNQSNITTFNEAKKKNAQASPNQLKLMEGNLQHNSNSSAGFEEYPTQVLANPADKSPAKEHDRKPPY